MTVLRPGERVLVVTDREFRQLREMGYGVSVLVNESAPTDVPEAVAALVESVARPEPPPANRHERRRRAAMRRKR